MKLARLLDLSNTATDCAAITEYLQYNKCAQINSSAISSSTHSLTQWRNTGNIIIIIIMPKTAAHLHTCMHAHTLYNVHTSAMKQF